MDIVKAFNSNNLYTEIVIKGTYEEPLFRASDIGEILNISAIRSVIRDFNETEKVVHSMHTNGGSQQVAFLTEKGLYKLLFKSRKPIAEKFQNWVCEVIKELRIKGTYELQKELEQSKEEILQVENKVKKEYEQKLIKEKQLERQEILLREFGVVGSLIYICKVKTFIDGSYIIKIGESRIGILSRFNEHKNKYEECLLLDCFLVNRSKDFESFLHNHENIVFNRIHDLHNHENERELFLVGNNLSYLTIINIIKNNIKYFNDYNNEVEKLKLELELLKCKTPNIIINDEFKELIENNKLIIQKIENLEKTNKEILNKLNSQQVKVLTGFNEPLVSVGNRLQKIHPETLQLVKVYESVSHCMKENNEIKRPSINKAIIENTIYHGFRWLLVDRNIDPNIIQNIKPTKITKIQNIGYIAKLNKEKTEILNVYLNKKITTQQNGYISTTSLDIPIKKCALTNGNYYILYNECDQKLRNNFVNKNNGEPLLYINGVGQYDSENNLIREFLCKYDCIKSLRISDRTLEKALTKSILYNGNYYKYLGSKIKCF